MAQTLQDAQILNGAQFEVDRTVPVSFETDAVAVQSARTGVAICDRSHWGRLQLTDADRQLFLHNQSTNDLKSLKPGEGRDTVFVTSTARTIDLATVYVQEAVVLLLVSPNRRTQLLSWLDRYIFFGDKVKLTDVTEQTAAFSLVGPESSALLEKLGAASIVGKSYANHQKLDIVGHSAQIAVGSGLAIEGYTLIVELASAASVWQSLVQAGAVPMGDRIWERLRIEQGRPVPDRELTEDFNPLEAGLWQSVSFNKGCYIGQETIARLDTYKGVKQQLWGVQLTASVPVGTTITIAEEKVGTLTSLTETEAGFFGLAYIRTKAGGPGLQVQVGDSQGEIVEVPFLTHSRE